MALTSKMAKYLAKERASIKGKSDRASKMQANDLDDLEMQKMKKAELLKIAEGKGAKSKAAKNELDRRQFNKEYGKSGEGGEPMTGPKQRELKKYYSGEKKFDELDPKAMGYGDEFRKGGMVKKKPAVKKPAVKKPVKKGK
jgi:hypothetical protein